MNEQNLKEILSLLLILTEENKDLLLDYHPYDIASCLENEANRELTIRVSNILGAKSFSNIYVHLKDDTMVDLLDDLGIKYVAEMLEEMEVDDASRLLSMIDHPKKYLAFVNKETASIIASILSYDDDFVGSIMNTNYLELDFAMNAKQATKKVMKEAKDVDFINVLFVTENHQFRGMIHLKDLIVADATDKIADIMDESIMPVLVDSDKEEAAKTLKNYDVEALAVVDDKKTMLGIITFDDVLDVTVDAAVEDYAAFAGMITDTIEHESENVFGGFKKRIVWLTILLFANLFTSTILGNYQNSFDDRLVAILSIFLPLILGMAGNTGTQSLAVTIRLIGTNDLDNFKEKMHHLFQELKVGLCNGVIIGIAMFFIVCLILLINKGTLDQTVLEVAITTAISVFFIMIVATVAGVLVPLLMLLIKVDPAVASGPFITTINDILALVIYFTLASFILTSIF